MAVGLQHRLTKVDMQNLDLYFPAIMAATQEGVWITDAFGATTYVNTQMTELFQSSVEEMKQKTRLDFLFDEDYQTAFRLTQKQFSGTSESFECRYRQTNGQERWTNVTTIPVHDKMGNYQGTVAMHTDITDRKLTENTRQKSQEDIWFIMDKVKDYAIIVIDKNRRIISWNTGAELLFGFASPEVIGQQVDIIFTPQDLKNQVPEKELATASSAGHASDDRWHKCKDGSSIYVNGVVTLLNQDSEPAKYIKIVRDWTEQKRLEEMLTNADKHKNEFLATLAHELRNPLASILSGLEALRQDQETLSRSKIQETIERQTQQMIHLVNDLLDISRISLGKIKINKQPVNLMDAIHLALDTSRPIINGHKHTLQVNLPDEVIVVDGDLTRLSQVFINILVNSAKYTPPGGVITITAYRMHNEAAVRIHDNGIGIPVHMLSTIFEIFQQIQDRSEYPQAGLGIGLSVVKHLVTMHNGQVKAFSEGENKGSEFVITLPVSASQVQPVHLENAPVKSGTHALAASQNKRVLLIDDNSDAADMMEILLKKRGYKIQKAYDGKSGIIMAMEFDPEIVLLDLGLPDIDGYEVLRTLKEKLGQRMFIAVSGWGQEEDLRRSHNAGFNHHLVKPVDIKTIEALLVSEV